jgi:hypothetical protein
MLPPALILGLETPDLVIEAQSDGEIPRRGYRRPRKQAGKVNHIQAIVQVPDVGLQS